MLLNNLFNIFPKTKVKKNRVVIRQEVPRNIWLVTGCSSGIGYAICCELLKRGYKVAACLRKKQRLDNLLIQYPNSLILLEMDVTNDEQVKEAINTTIERFGRIDVLVNNAGISHFGSIEETEIETVKKIFDVNFLGYVRTVKAILPHMRSRGAGLIINISSLCGLKAYCGVTYYSSSKFAIEGFTEALQSEVKSVGIDVFSVALSTARTNISLNLSYDRPKIPEYKQILSEGIRIIENKLEYLESKVSPEKVAKIIIDAAMYKDVKNLYLGTDCLNELVSKYSVVLDNVNAQMSNMYDVEYNNSSSTNG